MFKKQATDMLRNMNYLTTLMLPWTVLLYNNIAIAESDISPLIAKPESASVPQGSLAATPLPTPLPHPPKRQQSNESTGPESKFQLSFTSSLPHPDSPLHPHLVTHTTSPTLTAKSDRFFAAPKPPGTTRQS